MKSFIREVTRVVLPLAILGAGWGGFFLLGQRPEIPHKIPQPHDPLVETELAVESDGLFRIEIDGVAVPSRRITVSAEVDGRIKTKHPHATGGRYVTSGETLFEIDATDYQFEVDRLRALLAQAEAEISSTDVELQSTKSLMALAEESLKLQQKDLERNRRLIINKAASESLLDAARAKELSARQSLQTLRNQQLLLAEKKKTFEANRDLVQAQLNVALEELKRTQIWAPITGTVIEHFVEENDYVKRGEPVIRISDSQQMDIQTTLTVEELYWIWFSNGILSSEKAFDEQQRLEIPQVPVEVVFPFQEIDYLWQGTLSRYEGKGLDAQTRTVPCRVQVNRPTDVKATVQGKPISGQLPALYSGMFVTIRIPISSPVPLVKISLKALRPGDKVWVVRQGTLQILDVDVVHAERDYVLLKQSADGIHSGDHVVVSPLSTPYHGLAVREEGPS